jgi:hypothetical protein
MRRVAAALLVLLGACTVQRQVALTFGETGEGLDGFMCRDPATSQFLLDRAKDGDGGVRAGSLVFDFVRLGGVPGCRTGQLVKWCAAHECRAMSHTRSCVPLTLPTVTPMMPREELRATVLQAMKQAANTGVLSDAPDEFVIVRAVGTLQACDELLPAPGATELPGFDKKQLTGCAYSCPVLLDRVEQDVYLGFETLTGLCEQGVRTCSDTELHWQP